MSIVATSREPLAVAGEHVWSVEPLSTDGGPSVARADLATVPAVALFVERARAADPAFVLDATTAPVVVEICRRLDGIPLAIELAAARARAIDVTEIARRLDERFRLLEGDAPRQRPAPPDDARRHQLVVRPARARRAASCSPRCRCSPGRSISMPPSRSAAAATRSTC